MRKDGINRSDVEEALKGGHSTEPAESVRETWRYRVHAVALAVVVAFRSSAEFVAVTAWRTRT